MCQTFPAFQRHGIAVVLLAVLVLFAAAPVATAADACQGAAAVVPGFFNMMDIVQDRSRLIQFSVVAVALGIALLW
jgi:uncharacterized membrane protein HdeD (DUF308 family)